MRSVTTDLTAFSVYIAKILFIVVGIPLLILFALGTLNSMTLADIFSAKGVYWFVFAVIGCLSVMSKKFYYAFLVSIPFLLLYLYFGGIEHLHDWLY